MYNEGEGEGKHKGKRCEREAEGKQIEELNDERLYKVFRWKGELTSSVQFTMDSLRTVLSIQRGLYTSLLFVHMWLC